MLGLDTTAIIDLFKGDENLRKFLEDNNEPLATNTFNEFEIFFGIDPEEPRHENESKCYEELFDTTYNIAIDRSVCRRAAAIHWKLRKRGTPISKFDCAIAACFLENGVKKILTRNRKHFEKIDGLDVRSY